MLKLIAASMVAALPSAASAQSLTGTYTVAGTGPDGSTYTGAAVIKIEDANCSVVMAFGNGDISGSCLEGDGVLATSYVAGGQLTLVLYKVQPDGVLNGIWSVSGVAGTGTEVLTPN